MNNKNIKVAAIQMECITNDKAANVSKALKLIEKAAKEGSQLILLPEFFTTGYYSFREHNQELFQESETIPGPTSHAIGELAKKYGLYIVTPIFEKVGLGRYYNTAPLIGPDGEVLGKYSKTHIPAREKYYFRPGSEFPVFKTKIGNIGIIICYDRKFPETFRIVTLNGAEIILVPSSLFPRPKATVSEDWEYIARTRALENGVFAVFVNEAGEEQGMEYFGHSLIINPKGDVLARAGFDECIITATINLEEVELLKKRRYLQDRRPEIYSKLIDKM